MKNQTIIDQLKLRGSYGEIGNAQIGNYVALGVYSFAVQNAGNPASIPQRAPNRDLTWERANTSNIGLDLSIIKRIELNLDLYDKTSDALLLNVPLPATSGYTAVMQNVGAIRNRGLELTLQTLNL